MADFTINNLPETDASQVTETEIYTAIDNYFNSGRKIRIPSRVISTDAQIGKSQISLEANNAEDFGPDLQEAIDTCFERGGGKVFLTAGTYTVKTPITGRSGVDIIGENANSVIIDFANTSANLTFAATNVYNTGTIISIANGVTVTGSGTTWTADMAGRHMFIGTRWYLIASVTNSTTIVLAEGFADDSITFPGAAYRIADPVRDVILNELTIKNSTTHGIEFTDVRNILIEDATFITNGGVGLKITNLSHSRLEFLLAIGNTSDGFQLNNCGLLQIIGLASASNGGHGLKINNARYVPINTSSQQFNAGDGYNLTNFLNSSFVSADASGNTGQGWEFVSGCDDNFIVGGSARGNTGDGIKLTATCDNNTFGTALILRNNGGYGINIAASSCDDNTIAVPFFENNTSGDYADNGTNTNIVATIPNELVFQGSKDDGLTETTASSTLTRYLLNTRATLDNSASSWSLASGIFGFQSASTQFNWQGDYEYYIKLLSNSGAAAGGGVSGRGFFWGLAASSWANIPDNSSSSKINIKGGIIDDSHIGFLVDWDNKIWATSGTGLVTYSANANLASQDRTDISALVTHTDFNEYKIEFHYAAFPSLTDSGFVRPTAHSGGNSNQANMYDTDTTTFGFNERGTGSDMILLSGDGGTTWTQSIGANLQAAKTTQNYGGQYDTWGLKWTTSMLSNANFRLRLCQGNFSGNAYNNTMSDTLDFSSFGFSTGSMAEITGIEVELTQETEDEGDGGGLEWKIYDVRVKIHYATTANTGYAKFYVNDTLVATHTASIPRSTDTPIFLIRGLRGDGTGNGGFVFYNNYYVIN